MSRSLRLSKKLALSVYDRGNLNAIIIGHGATGIIKDNICCLPEGINSVIIDLDNRLWNITKDTLFENECEVYHCDPYAEPDIDVSGFYQRSAYPKYMFINFATKDDAKNQVSLSLFVDAINKAKIQTGWYGEDPEHTRFVFYDFSARSDIAKAVDIPGLLKKSNMFNISFLLTIRHIEKVEKNYGKDFVSDLKKISNKVFGNTKNYDNLCFYEDVTGRSSTEITNLQKGSVLVTLQKECLLEDYGLTA